MRAVFAFLVVCTSANAQEVTPAFEAATVKVNDNPDGGNGFFPTPGRLRAVNFTLLQLIQAAFHVRTGTLFGASAWMQSDRFDIDAKATEKSTFDDDLRMLQSLLIDRFGLRYHRETRELRTQVLVIAKSGLKFKASPDQTQKEQIAIRPAEISGTAIPFGHFVSVLEAKLGYPLKNETGMTGKFDLDLKYVPDDATARSYGPSLFAALEEQLGLKLEARRGPAEVFVIDSAARPREN
jgi:uncharacterized protein (TIGR03435 family)